MGKTKDEAARETIAELRGHPSDVSQAAVAFLETLKGAQSEKRKTVDVLYLFIESLKYEMEATVELPDGTFALRSEWKDCSGYSISNYLDYWLPRKVISHENLRVAAPSVLRKWLKWCFEQRYFNEKSYSDFMDDLPRTKAKDLKRLDRAGELLARIHNPDPGGWRRKDPSVVPIHQRKKPEAYEEGYMEVVELGVATAVVKTMEGRRFEPVLLSSELCVLLKVGDVVNVGIGKYGKNWKVLESGNVYSEGVLF